MICWHLWIFSPCLVTGVLFWLNISNYAIGREIGTNSKNTGIILSVIVVCAKLHEILIVAGLLNIVRQAIQRGLTQGGMLLGLLGDEKSLQTVLFICSQEFRPAFRYGFSEGPRSLKMKIRRIVAVIFVVCCLFTVVGPASNVLIVPKLGWFDKTLAALTATSSFKLNFSGAHCFSYIIISPLLASNYLEVVPDQREPKSPYKRNARISRRKAEILM